MVKEECSLNVVQYLCSLFFSIASSFSYECWCVLIPVLWSNRKPKQAPAVTLSSLFHNTSAGECAPFRESRTESSNKSVLFKAANVIFLSEAALMLQYLVGVLVFKVKTIDLFLVTYIFKWTGKWDKIAEKLEIDLVFFITPINIKFWFSFQISVFLWFYALSVSKCI